MDSSAAVSMKASSAVSTFTDLDDLCRSRKLFRDRYRIVQALGRGGFGVTYLARDMVLPGLPECVIKQLRPKTTNQAILRRAAERFEREARILGQLGSHAQIPQLLAYFEHKGEFFLVQEYIRGYNLARELKTKGVSSEATVKRFLREILPVLEYVHQNQVIHRDIKPLNIIRCQDDDRLVLIDFGAVKEQIIEAGELTQRATTQFIGTVGFAPPEQLALRPVYASDIYAIGVTCLYMLTGRPPMEFESDLQTGEILWRKDVQVSPYFGQVLDRMLKVSLCDRYRSAAQVLRALELEPYLDKLADCMTTQPPVSRSQAVEQSEEISPYYQNRYVPPMTRTAIEIRNWRARLKARQQRLNRLHGDVLNSSCCG